MVATTLTKPQTPVTHCGNCPLNHNNTCTATHYPVHPNMPITAACHRDIARADEQSKAQIEAQAEPIRFTDDLTLIERRKAAAFLETQGRNVDPTDVLELRLCPQNVKWGKGQFWFVIRNVHAPLAPDLFPAEIVDFEGFKAPVQEPVTKLPIPKPQRIDTAYLQKLQATLPPHLQHRVAAIFTIDSTPRMRAVTICYRADYILADGRKGVMFYEHGKEPTDVIRTMANVPVWVEPVGMHPRYKTWRVELIGTIDGVPQAA